MNTTSPGKFASRLLILALSLFACLSAQATTSLSWSTMNHVAIPAISTNETSILSGPYRLRAKFYDGSPNGFHAATANNNNNGRLNALPPAGTYTVDLYSVTYTDYTYTTGVAIGPVTTVTVTVMEDFALRYDTTSWDGYAIDAQGGLYSFSGYTTGTSPNIGATGSALYPPGNYYWGWSGSHTTTASATALFTCTSLGTTGGYTVNNFSYTAGGALVYVR